MAVVYSWVIARFMQWRTFNGNQSRTARDAAVAADGNRWIGVGGAHIGNASVTPSFLACFYPSVLLPAILFLREHDSLHVITGLLMLVYLSLMMPFELRVYRD
jgi:hypothetical protein